MMNDFTEADKVYIDYIALVLLLQTSQSFLER